jgi:hypothetical protein
VQALPWAQVTGHAWAYTYMQIARTFILQRIDANAFRDLPGTDSARAPPPAALASSNVYSPAEAVLLAWLEVHTRKVLPRAAKRLTSFGGSLADSVALCCALASHWPPLAKHLPALAERPRSAGDAAANARVLLTMLESLQCPFKLREEHVTGGKACELLFFVAYLFSWLPQLVPRSTVEFAGKLQEPQIRDVELSNPSKKPLSYVARLSGHADFSLINPSVRVEPGGTAVCQVQCRPSTGVTQSAHLVLASRRDGGAVGATLTFHLVSKARITHRCHIHCVCWC